jgi:2-dehydro-3-deoxy-D-gluconate 5-dehydrogenase
MGTSFDLTGRTALVTGAGTGLGQGMAVGLAEAGATVVAVDRREPAETMAVIRDAGGRCEWIRAELGGTADYSRVIDEAASRCGDLHILVNNAGIIRRADAVEFTEADWDDVMDVNLKAVFFLSQAMARHMLSRCHGGKIINVASMLSFQGGIRVASYTSSKSGVAGLTKLLANEWAVKGINVNAIAPGYFATNNTAALRADGQRNRDILARIPAGRWGTPSDLAGAVVFLASPASNYVNGTVIAVDGGWLAR